jgi:hypothetical protein
MGQHARWNKMFLFVLFFLLAAFMISCGGSGGGSGSNSQANDEAKYYGMANLSWISPTTNTDGSKLTDLAGYKIYYGTTPGSHDNWIDVGNVTKYTINDLCYTPGTAYYFVVRAYNDSGGESADSEPVEKTFY